MLTLANCANDVSEMDNRRQQSVPHNDTHGTLGRVALFFTVNATVANMAPNGRSTQRYVGAWRARARPLFLRAALLLLPPSQTHPGRGDVHHDLLEGGRLLGLSLGVQRYLLAKLSGV